MHTSIHIPNVLQPAHFDANLHQWVARKTNDVISVFAKMVEELYRRMREGLHGLLRVEFYGVEQERLVYVKCIQSEGDYWEKVWLFDFEGSDFFFFPYAA